MILSNPRGSVALSTLLSTTIGVTLALLYVNIARYTAGMNAVEQATRQVIRCLAPTDGGCSTYESVASAPSWEWFRTNIDSLGELRARRFNYSGTLYLDRWRAQFPYFEIDQVIHPSVTWQSYRISVRRFESIPLSEYRFVRHQRTAEHDVAIGYMPAAGGPIFPNFLEEDERDLDRRSPDAWSQSTSKNGFSYGRFREATIVGAERTIRSGRTAVFVTNPITIGTPLPGALPCASGEKCSAADLAGGSANTDFRTHAFVAIKAFAEIRRHPGSARPTTVVRWGRDSGDPNQRFGLELVRPGGAESECLGGRSNSGEIGSQWEDFNLWLRGPAAANGGTSSVCPGGDLDHSNLRVLRGSQIRVRAWLSADDAHGDADVRVRIFYYYDDYQLKSEPVAVSALCPEVQIRPGMSGAQIGALCPSLALCGFDSSFRDLGCTLSTEPVRKETTCEPDLAKAFPAGAALERFVATCQAGDRFEASAEACGWRDTGPTGKTQVVGPEGATCDGSTLASPRVEPCEATSSVITRACDGNYGNPLGCTIAGRAFRSEQSSLDSLPSVIRNGSLEVSGPTSLSSPALDPKLRTLKNPEWATPLTAAPYPSWASTDLQGKEVACARSVTGTVENAQPIFARLKGSWHPERSAFPLSLNGVPIPPEIPITLTRVGDLPTPVRVTGVYPFQTRPEIEIGDFIPEMGSSATCASGSPASLEERLRYYASAEYPEAALPEVRFDHEAAAVDEISIGKADGCGELSALKASLPHPCAKYKTVSGGSRVCSSALSLGTYADGEKPSECAGEIPAHLCRREPVISSISAAPPIRIINSSLALERGYRELTRILPGVQTHCSGSGCARVIVDTSDPARSTVRTEYEIPLTFPLDTFLGRDSMTISSEMTERYELEMVGPG